MDFRFSQKIWLCFLESTKQLRNSSDLLLKRDFFSSETDVIRGRVGENNENFIVAKFVKSGVNSYMSSTQQKKYICKYNAHQTGSQTLACLVNPAMRNSQSYSLQNTRRQTC